MILGSAKRRWVLTPEGVLFLQRIHRQGVTSCVPQVGKSHDHQLISNLVDFNFFFIKHHSMHTEGSSYHCICS